MGDVGAEKDDRLAEDLGPYARYQNGVDAAELHVDLQAEVGQRLRRRLVHVLGLENVESLVFAPEYSTLKLWI